MARGMSDQFTVGEVKDGLKKIDISMDIPRVPSSSTEANIDEIIDVTIAKHKGSAVDLEPKVRTIHGDLKSISSMAINVPDQEMVNVKLKVESEIITGTNPSSSTPGENNPSSVLLPHTPLGPTVSLSPQDLEMKTTSLLEEYFTDGLLDKASKCIEDLRSPSHHTQIVKESMLLGFEKNPAVVDSVFNLLDHLLKKEVFVSDYFKGGCLQLASTLGDFNSDLELTRAADLLCFGRLIGKLVSSGVIDFKVVKWILVGFDEEDDRIDVFDSLMGCFRLGDPVFESQFRDVLVCRKLSLCE